VTQLHPENCSDDSVQASNQAHVNINRFTLPKQSRELILATITAFSVLTSLWLWSKLHDAEKDIQTQIWLKQNADEERFEKFVSGPYAQLAGKVEASQILFAKCQESKR
jgi:C4-dicarboxylate transporter